MNECMEERLNERENDHISYPKQKQGNKLSIDKLTMDKINNFYVIENFSFLLNLHLHYKMNECMYIGVV